MQYSYYSDSLEKKLQKISLQKALSERKSDEARRLLDAGLQDLDFLSAARISEVCDFNISGNIEKCTSTSYFCLFLCSF